MKVTVAPDVFSTILKKPCSLEYAMDKEII